VRNQALILGADRSAQPVDIVERTNGGQHGVVETYDALADAQKVLSGDTLDAVDDGVEVDPAIVE
jgi:hypothetical protein